MVKDILEKYKGLIWPEIQNYLTEPVYSHLFRIPKKYQKDAEFHWKMVRDYPERQGKYLRPALLMLTAEAMDTPIPNIIKTASAMQISEDWLLIHDDFEDGSLIRRGKPTLHKIYGGELAVNAGDALHIIMWKILADNTALLGQKKALEIMDEFYKILARTTVGQTTEIKWAKTNKTDFNNNDWFFVADGKTSYYTIAGPMRLGAILAGATSRELNSLSKFGLYLGRCFQLVDDILDLTSDFGGLKKQTGNDIYEGKRTVMLGHLLRSIKGKDKKRTIAILGKNREQKSEDEVGWILSMMDKFGSIAYARSIAQSLKERAFKIFKEELKFLDKEPSREQLERLIHFVLEREH